MRTAFFWIITQRAVVISYRRFGTTYQSYLQGPRISISEQSVSPWTVNQNHKWNLSYPFRRIRTTSAQPSFNAITHSFTLRGVFPPLSNSKQTQERQRTHKVTLRCVGIFAPWTPLRWSYFLLFANSIHNIKYYYYYFNTNFSIQASAAK
jgi:hypothetical protein